jgi:uncharacterized membrane protein HdeD (DUF308 family)
MAILLLAVFLLLTGLNLLGVVAVSATVLGIIAILAGILFLVNEVHPLPTWRRN